MVPYGRAHGNPPAGAEPAWDPPVTRDPAVRACYDCHSNETEWPWYTNIAPVSRLTTRDVEDGRHRLNFSEWGSGEQRVDEIARVVQQGEMPPIYFGWMHKRARLTDAETQQLVQGLQATFGRG